MDEYHDRHGHEFVTRNTVQNQLTAGAANPALGTSTHIWQNGTMFRRFDVWPLVSNSKFLFPHWSQNLIADQPSSSSSGMGEFGKKVAKYEKLTKLFSIFVIAVGSSICSHKK
jgi:hypothetical protein